MFRNKYFLLVVGISIFLAGYLYYVKKDREQSINNYLSQPVVGDIYKMEIEDDDGSFVHYWKVMEVHEKGLVFVTSKMKAWGSVDYLQKHFDEMLPFSYTYDEIRKFAHAKEKENLQNMRLIEIVRKQ